MRNFTRINASDGPLTPALSPALIRDPHDRADCGGEGASRRYATKMCKFKTYSPGYLREVLSGTPLNTFSVLVRGDHRDHPKNEIKPASDISTGPAAVASTGTRRVSQFHQPVDLPPLFTGNGWCSLFENR